MKHLSLLAGLIALGGLAAPGHAVAACTGNAMNQNQLNNTFPGNTVCAERGADRWQEFHQVGGALIDYKKGPSDPVDPTKQVGNWSVSGTGNNARMVYNYGSGGTYSYQVFSNGGTYSFCNGNEVHNATVRSGQVSCGFN